jgi:WD40 repeat protein
MAHIQKWTPEKSRFASFFLFRHQTTGIKLSIHIIIMDEATIFHTQRKTTRQVTGICYSPHKVPVQGLGTDHGRGRDAAAHTHCHCQCAALLATCGDDGTVEIHQQQRIVSVFKGHVLRVHDISWSPDGRFIASAGSDMAVFIWQLPSSYCISGSDHYDESDIVMDSQRLPPIVAYGSHNDIPGPVQLDSTQKDAEMQVQSRSDTKASVICDTVTIEPDVLRGHVRKVSGVSWSRNGKWLAAASADWSISIWERCTSSDSDSESGPESESTQPTLKAKSDSESDSKQNCITNAQQHASSAWKRIQVLKSHDGPVGGVAFCPDSSMLVSHTTSEADKGCVHVWDCKTWECTQTLDGHSGTVSSLSFGGSRGTRLAFVTNRSESLTSRVHIWERDLDTNKWYSTFTIAPKSITRDIALSHNGDRLALACRNCVQLWGDIGWSKGNNVVQKQPKQLCQLGVPAGGLHMPVRLCFNADDSELACVSHSGIIRAWSTITAQDRMLSIFPSSDRKLQPSTGPGTSSYTNMILPLPRNTSHSHSHSHSHSSTSFESDSTPMVASIIGAFFSAPLMDINVLRIIRQYI